MSEYKIAPIGNKVLAKIIKEEPKTGSLLLLAPQETRHIKASVLACGNLATSVKPGDLILVQKYGYQEIKLDEDEFIMLKCEDILATLTEA